MAASIRSHGFSRFQKICGFLSHRSRTGAKCQHAAYSTQNEDPSSPEPSTRDPGPLYIKPEVLEILKKVTGLSLDRIFAERQTVGIHPPKYKLLTNKQLQEEEENALQKAEQKLQMPPVMKAYKDEEVVISNDPLIDGHDTHKIVFTDITYGLHDRKRTIVVREPQGKLRFAERKERERMLQTYFTKPGRMMHMPKMFEEEHLENILAEHRYMYVLERACVQFEPDDPIYIRVTQRTYEHIDTNAQYEDLRSSRFFGGMAFYFAMYNRMDGLLVDMISRELLSDAADMVRLYHILHPTCKSAANIRDGKDDLALIQAYIDNDAKDKGRLELALQSYEESLQRPSATMS